MVDIKAELVTRINNDIWIRSLMNGGCNLVKSNPKYDNHYKAILICDEGILDLAFIENRYPDSNPNFFEVAVNFRSQNKNLIIRVDNKGGNKNIHYHIIEDGIKHEDHAPLNYNDTYPLKFAIEKVLEIFKDKYSFLIKNWQTFNIPSLTFLSKLLVFGPNVEGILNFPITLVYYPGSQITMQIYSRKIQNVRLIPMGFVIEKKY